MEYRMKHCKLCKKPANEVDIVHRERKGSSLTPGYCLGCQDWVFMGFLLIIFGFTLSTVGLIQIFRGDYLTLPTGIGLFFFGLAFPDIIGLFYKKMED